MACALVVLVGGITIFSGQAGALDVGDACTAVGNDTPICTSRQDNVKTGFVGPIVNTILFILGVAAVIAIVIGGIRYTTSNGDASQIQSAKNTIMYAVIGLVVALMAGGIVNFVFNNFQGGSYTGGGQSSGGGAGPGGVNQPRPAAADPCQAIGGSRGSDRCVHPCEANISSCPADLRVNYISKCQATGKSEAECIGTAPAP